MTTRGLVIAWAVLVATLAVPAAPAAADTQADLAARANRDGLALLSARFRDAATRVPEPVYFTNLCESGLGEGTALIDRIKAAAHAQRVELAPAQN